MQLNFAFKTVTNSEESVFLKPSFERTTVQTSKISQILYFRASLFSFENEDYHSNCATSPVFYNCIDGCIIRCLCWGKVNFCW